MKYGLKMLDTNTINTKKLELPKILKGVVSPYLSKEDERFREYINITKKDAQSNINTYPIHLTEMLVQEYNSVRQPFSRFEYTMSNSSLIWMPTLTELVVYDDYGIDLFMKSAIELAKEHNVKITYKKYFGW